MNLLKLLVTSFCLILSLSAFSQEENCNPGVIPAVADAPVRMVDAIMSGMYKEIISLKVNHDGEGSLSVYYEDGKPTILRMTYKSKKGLVEKSIPLDGSRPLVYENPDIPGPAIVVEKLPGSQPGKMQFQLKVRSELRPELPEKGTFTSYKIDFDTDINNPSVTHRGKPFKKVVIAPGVSMFSWDGTFKRVDFKD